MATEGYRIMNYGQPVKRYVQTMELRDNPELIRLYRLAHSKEECWPEIREGIRSVGILEMDIYILGTRLVMIVETPLDFDWKTAMDRLATMPRQQEWEQYVGQFQDYSNGMRSDEKWQLMDRMFHLYENETND